MHAGNVVERLRNPHPARQHGDIGNEAGVAHELIALGPGVASEYSQFSLIRGEAEDRVERSGLACTVGTDESEDAALCDAQIDAVERDGCAERLTKTVCFYDCHGFSASPWGDSTRWISTVRHLQTAGWSPRSGVLPPSGRAAEWLRGSGATLLQETSAARLGATGCARRH